MGPQAAINAVFFNQVQAIEDPAEREAFVEKLRRSTPRDRRLHLASELVVDAVMQPEDLRAELVRRFSRTPGALASGRPSTTPSRRSDSA